MTPNPDPTPSPGAHRPLPQHLPQTLSLTLTLDQARIGRFHNIYGPCGTWKGGREKAPAAFCRKGITSETEFEMWGNGKQTRSFC